MTTKQTAYHILTIFSFLLASCDLSASVTEQGLPAQTEPLTAVVPTGTVVTSGQLTAISESPNGAVIYDDGQNIVSIDPDTGETKVLISRKELQILFTEDRSGDSYTYGYERPIPIALSPDFSKALVTICADLDSRFRCVFENYVYILESKSGIRLPALPGAYGVYWKWSPDGSQLAGAAWGYDQAFYKLTHFYAVDAEGDVLIPLVQVTNEHWQIAWNPSGKAFHPLTFVTNFQSIHPDKSKIEDVPIPGLEWNDKVDCLSFSPDDSRVVLIIRREIQKDHALVYIARSNFTEVTQLAEYDIDSRYLCSVDWSPDQRFVHIRYEVDTRVEAGEEQDDSRPRRDKIINIETNSLLETPKDLLVCGWTPDNNLVYERISIAGEEGGIEIFNPSNSEPVSVPVGLQATVKHCPVQWLKESLTFEVPVGLSIKNACHPGALIQDAEEETPVPDLFDLMEVSTTLQGETLSVTLTFKAANADLTAYLTPDVDNFINGLDVFIDIDNNALSGDNFGMEYALSVGIVPGSNEAAPTLEGVLGKIDSTTGMLVRQDKFTPSFDPSAKTISFTKDVPNITAKSRLVIITRMVNMAKTLIISDRVCD